MFAKNAVANRILRLMAIGLTLIKSAQLKTSNSHFAKLFDEYHDLDHEVHRIETGVENTSDEYLEEQKKKRLHLKDQLYTMIREHEASVAG